MKVTEPSKDEPKDGSEPFGKVLGADFEPLGRRLIVPAGKNANPLKIRLQTGPETKR